VVDVPDKAVEDRITIKSRDKFLMPATVINFEEVGSKDP